MTDLKGMVFGELTVVGFSHIKKYGERTMKYFWMCKCSCGNEIIAEKNAIQKHKRDCGCVLNIEDLSSKKFGKLTVMSYSHCVSKGSSNKYYWKCNCDCGNSSLVRSDALKDGKVKSCGCVRKDNKEIGDRTRTHGLTKTRPYQIWAKIKGRCYDSNNIGYKDYGGKGITMCCEWIDNPVAFINWANANGYNDNLSIDRIDYNGNYEPSNCKWSTDIEQANNKSNNVFIEYNGETHTIAQWSRILGINIGTIAGRIKHKFPVEQVLHQGRFHRSIPR